MAEDIKEPLRDETVYDAAEAVGLTKGMLAALAVDSVRDEDRLVEFDDL